MIDFKLANQYIPFRISVPTVRNSCSKWEPLPAEPIGRLERIVFLCPASANQRRRVQKQVKLVGFFLLLHFFVTTTTRNTLFLTFDILTMDYTGFSFAEKKSLKSGEPKYEAALKQIQDKLGADWKLHLDFPAFATAIPDGHSERHNLLYALYDNYCPYLGNEVAGYEPDLVEAINEKITDKKITITTDKTGESLDRYRVTVGKDIVIAVEAPKVNSGYPYSSSHCMKSAIEKAL